MQPNMLNTKQAAEWLSCAPSTLAKARVTGDGPPYVKYGASVRYRVDDLENWTAAHVRQSTSE